MENLNLYIKEANKRFVRVMSIQWLFMMILFFACLLCERHLIGLARWAAEYVPAIDWQLTRGTTAGDLAGTYFGVAALLLPIMVLTLIWRQSALKRLRFGLSRFGGGMRAIIFVYFVGIPFLLFLLFTFYAAPFGVSENPRLAGQHVANLMLNTPLGLLIFGSLLLIVNAILIAMLLALLWFPFALVIEKIMVK